jgi:hypothetical protein
VGGAILLRVRSDAAKDITEGICAVSGRVEVRVGATVSVTLRMLPAAC